MISRTKMKSRLRNKTNPELVETLSLAMKHKPWRSIAKLLSSSTRKLSSVNLFEIEKNTKAGDTVIVPGKILSKGELTKKLRLCSLAISEKAKEKLKETKSEAVSIAEEIKKNPKADGLLVIK